MRTAGFGNAREFKVLYTTHCVKQTPPIVYMQHRVFSGPIPCRRQELDPLI